MGLKGVRARRGGGERRKGKRGGGRDGQEGEDGRGEEVK